ncbi:MAG TPA: hypothetical protein VMZ92_12355 [Planctomycetota bacterium]|nr:hypothetical protein [Planctomycetota bacterium]
MAQSISRAGRSRGWQHLIPESFRTRVKTFFARLFLTLAVACILCCCFIILRNFVARLDCYQVDARTLVPRNLPSWAGDSVRRDLSVLPGLPQRFSIMEPGICERIAAAFEANPWVDRVLSVRKLYPNRIFVEMTLRRPVAGVRVRGLHYLVDAFGYRLTEPFDTWSRDADGPPVILSSVRRIPEPGQQWSHDGVRAGAAVAEVLRLSRDRLETRFAAVDVTNIGGCRDRHKSEITLITHEGTTVQWGRSPLLVNSPGELTPEEKLIKMILFEKKRGPLSGYRYVDIRFDNVQHGPRVGVLSDRTFGN